MLLRFTAKLRHASSLLCLAGIVIPGTGFADDAPVAATSSATTSDTDSGGLAEIVVTANKIEEASSKVGATIQTIDTQALQQQQVTTLQDLANVVPGLTFTETEFATPVYTRRGVATPWLSTQSLKDKLRIDSGRQRSSALTEFTNVVTAEGYAHRDHLHRR